MRIGELSERTGVSRDALRFYEKRGLLDSRRQPNGYRDYPQDAPFLVHVIRTAQRLGFSLAEIADHLPRVRQAAEPEKAVAELIRGKLQVIDERIAELTSLRDRLMTHHAGATCPFQADSLSP